jgi:hypothetical protein
MPVASFNILMFLKGVGRRVTLGHFTDAAAAESPHSRLASRASGSRGTTKLFLNLLLDQSVTRTVQLATVSW